MKTRIVIHKNVNIFRKYVGIQFNFLENMQQLLAPMEKTLKVIDKCHDFNSKLKLTKIKSQSASIHVPSAPRAWPPKNPCNYNRVPSTTGHLQ